MPQVGKLDRTPEGGVVTADAAAATAGVARISTTRPEYCQ